MRSRVMSRTDSGDRTSPTPAAIIEAKADRSSTVDTSQPAALGIFGGADAVNQLLSA